MYVSDFPPFVNSGATGVAIRIVDGLIGRGHDIKILSVSCNWIEPRKEKYNIKRIFVEPSMKLRDNPIFHITDKSVEDELIKEVDIHKPDLVFFMDIQNIPANLILRLKENGNRIAGRFSNLYPFCIKLHRFKYPPCKLGVCNGINDENECNCCYEDYFQSKSISFKNPSDIHDFIHERRHFLTEVYKSFDLLISPSRYLKDFYNEKLGRNVKHISTGIDSIKNIKWKNNGSKIVFSYFGLLDYRKGIDLFLKAIDNIDIAEAEFRVYGGFSENMPAITKPQIKKIKFYGKYKKSDMKHILSDTDIAVIPSTFENCPNIVLELMNNKTPVIASDTESMSELIQDKINGLLFENGNYAKLEQAIKLIIKDPLLINKYSENISDVKNTNQFVDEIENVFMKIPQGSSGGNFTLQNETLKKISKYKFVNSKKSQVKDFDEPNIDVKGILDAFRDSASPKAYIQRLADKYFYLGRHIPEILYYALGKSKNPNLNEAIHYLEFLERRKTFSELEMFFIGKIYMRLKYFKKAEIYFKKIISGKYSSSYILYMSHINLAALYLFILNPKKRKKHNHEVITLLQMNKSRTILQQTKLVEIYSEIGDEKNVLNEIGTLVEMIQADNALSSVNSLSQYRIASLLKKNGKLDESLLWFRNIVDVEVESVLIGGAYFHIGEIYLWQKKIGSSKFFKKVLELIPEHLKALEYLKAECYKVSIPKARDKKKPEDPDEAILKKNPKLVNEYNKKVREIVRSMRNPLDTRNIIASLYLNGSGIELGALHRPTPVDADTEVFYVDRATLPDHRRIRTNLAHEYLAYSNIIDDGEELYTIDDNSFDFLIASHFLEHSSDVIKTLKNHVRVIKRGGILVYIIPDKRYTFDKPRKLTKFDHIEEDYLKGESFNRIRHYEEYFSVINKLKGKKLKETIEAHKDEKIDIHYHVWTSITFKQHLNKIIKKEYLDIEIVSMFQNHGEFFVILKNKK